MINPILGVNVIVAVGSVDGMAGAAACIRHAGDASIQVVFTQAFQVCDIDVSKWLPGRKVGFVDLGVNTAGNPPNIQMTVDFVKRICEASHTILFIADEHGKKSWYDVLGRCGIDKEQLTIRPKDRSEKCWSSCAILYKAFGESADCHTKALLCGGDQADRLNVDTYFGYIFTRAVKSNKYDLTRRPYLVNFLAKTTDLDMKIKGWMNEYAAIEANLPRILATKWILSPDFWFYDASNYKHDATAVFKEAYKTSTIVVLRGRSGVSIGTIRQNFNLLEILQRANIVAGGMATKVNFSRAWENEAIQAVFEALSSPYVDVK